MTIIIDFREPNHKEFMGMAAAISCCGDELLSFYLNKNLNLDVIFKKESGSFNTFLSYAIRFNNENAVRIICAKMRANGILAHHLSTEILEATPLHFASFIGNPSIATILLSHGADPEAYSGKKDAKGETPLMSAVRHLSSFSLIEHGDWGGKELREKLQLWYVGEGEFPEAAVAVDWSGNIKLITALLKKKGVDPTAPDKNDVSPYDLLTSLTNPKHRSSTFHDGTSNPKVLSVTDDVIVFEARISNRENSETKTIKVTYDVRELRKLLADKIELNKREGHEQEKKKFQELKGEIRQVKRVQKPLVKEHKAKEERKKLIEGYSSTIGARTFFTIFNQKMNSEISVIGDILTDKVDRAHYAIADKAADGVGALSDLPVVGAVVGGAPKLLGKGIQLASDLKEKKKHVTLIKNVPLPAQVPFFCEDIALGILNYYGAQVSQLNATRAEAFTGKVLKLVYETLTQKDLGGDAALITKIVIDAINSNDKIAKKLQKLLDEQLKDNAKHAAAATPALPQTLYVSYKSKAQAAAAGAGASASPAKAADPDKEKCVLM